MTTLSIRRIENDPPAHYFYTKFRGQLNPCPVYLYLDLQDGEMYVEAWTGGENSFPSATFNGTLRRWKLGGIPTPDQAHDLMDELSEKAQRILDGSDVEFVDGDWKGSLTEEAKKIEAEIDGHCLYRFRGLVVQLDAEDYFYDTDEALEAVGVTAETTDDEIEALTASWFGEGDEGELIIIPNLDDYLKEARDGLKGPEDE